VDHDHILGRHRLADQLLAMSDGICITLALLALELLLSRWGAGQHPIEVLGRPPGLFAGRDAHRLGAPIRHCALDPAA